MIRFTGSRSRTRFHLLSFIRSSTRSQRVFRSLVHSALKIVPRRARWSSSGRRCSEFVPGESRDSSFISRPGTKRLATRFRPMRGSRVPAKSGLTLAEHSNDLGDQPRPEIPLESGYLSIVEGSGNALTRDRCLSMFRWKVQHLNYSAAIDSEATR